MNALGVESTISFENVLANCSKRLMEADGKTILNYVLSTKNDGVIALSLLPYLALYCRSAQEFFGKRVIEGEVDRQINDLRNGLKIFSDRYSKGKEATLNSDDYQNELYKDMLRFSFTKSLNIHYNLGVYFDMDGHIIGDTQILNYFLNSTFKNVKDQEKYSFEIGRMLGEKIGFILETIGSNTTLINSDIFSCPKYGYRDFNTNRKSDFFVHTTDKEINLIILHILSSVGFVLHILRPMLPKDNLWGFRIEYVVAHYAWSGLRKIKQHYSNTPQNDYFANDICFIINKGTDLFPSTFRNCMMHYSLYDKNMASNFEKCYNSEVPFYGLIECCFEGESFNDFSSSLKQFMIELEECLLSWFHVDMHKVKWDLKIHS